MREVIWEVSDYINSYNCILIRKRSNMESCFLTKIVSTSILAHYFLWWAITLERFCKRVWTNSRSEVWTHSCFFFLTYKETLVHALVQERCHNKLALKIKWQNSFLDVFIYRAHVKVVWATGNIFCNIFNLTAVLSY